VAKEDEIPGALDAAKKSGAVALNVLASSLLFSARMTVILHVAALRLRGGSDAVIALLKQQLRMLEQKLGLIGPGERKSIQHS
jgi:hypothetical protein